MNWDKQIEKIGGLKNLMIGFLLGVCVVLLTGASVTDRGPYLCCAAGTNEVAAFIVDSRDGHTWRIAKNEFSDFGIPAAHTAPMQQTK